MVPDFHTPQATGCWLVVLQAGYLVAIAYGQLYEGGGNP